MNARATGRAWQRGAVVVAAAVLTLLSSRSVLADFGAYKGQKELTAQGGDVRARHWHDWSQVPVRPKAADVFSADNDYSYVELFHGPSKRRVGRQPCPPLTRLWVAPDGSYVVGLSNIKRSNLYQFVVFRGTGRLVHKEHIASEEACFSDAELAEFLNRFPKAREAFEEWSRTIGGTIYVDAFRTDARERIGLEAQHALEAHRCPGRYPVPISESVVNRRRWFHRRNPAIELVREGSKLTAVSLLDRDGRRFSIPVHDDAPLPAPVRSTPTRVPEPVRDPSPPQDAPQPEPAAPGLLGRGWKWWVPRLLGLAAVAVLIALRRRIRRGGGT